MERSTKIIKAAVSGINSGHILAILQQLRQHPHVRVVAAAEREPRKNAALVEKAQIELTHDSPEAMLREADFDVLISGDIYRHRGPQAVAALQAGKHVLGDKPLCLALPEFTKIASLAGERGLSVMALLSLPYHPLWQAARAHLRRGVIGEIATAFVSGRHELKYASRPRWFFEENSHGGTINDILIHGICSVEWLSNLRITKTVAARAWNQQLRGAPHFQDCAHVLMQLDNGAGVIMDGSFTKPAGHKEPWVIHLHGTEGDLRLTNGSLVLRRHHEPVVEIAPEDGDCSDLAGDFLAEIGLGNGRTPTLTTQECLRYTHVALVAQQMADHASNPPGALNEIES